MGKVEVVDDCLAPTRHIYMEYRGTDPYGIAKKIASTLRPFFHVSGSGTAETYFMWDDSADPKAFYFRWWVYRKLSRFTIVWFYIWIRGELSRETNEGHFTMRIHADLRTTFSGYGLFIRPFWHVYSFFFYNRRRRQYLRLCRDLAHSFRNEMKEHYNLEVGIKRSEI